MSLIINMETILNYFSHNSDFFRMVSNIKFDNVPRPTAKSIRQRPIVFTIFILE